MTVLLDTNILLRLANPVDPAQTTAVTAIAALRANGAALCTVPQNLFEFWVAATRPVSNNGLGLSTTECMTEIAHIKVAFPVQLDSPALLAEWEKLVAAHDCKGKVAHDARLVAAMQILGIAQIMTFNISDFTRFPGLTILDPAKLSAPSAAP
jgi:predicted nucleic acid-binding protein